MEDLRKAANYYLETASEEYKKRAKKAMDGGKSLEDFYVGETKRCIRKCNVCSKVVVGFYFCCTKCELFNKGYNYNLCVECFYGGRTFKHEHDTFADNHSVLMMHTEGRGEPTCVIEKNDGKRKQVSNSISDASSSLSKPTRRDSSLKDPSSQSKPTPHDSSLNDSSSRSNSRPSNSRSESTVKISYAYLTEPSHSMLICSRVPAATKIKIDENGVKKLTQIADAHYNAAPQKIRDSADKFFWSMVKQRGKTRVTMEDFVESMKEKRYPEYAHPELFQILVKDREKGMELSESRTLYYIVLTGKPFCSWCKCFIPDIYFCCSKCSARSYALCLHCYSTKAYVNHRHYRDDDVFFLDYTVLHNTIKATPAHTSQASGRGSPPSTAIVRTNPRDNKAVTAFEMGKAILNAGAAVLSIASTTLGGCTIL